MNKALEAVKEASISIACLLDEPTKVTVKDLKHLQNQITVRLKQIESESLHAEAVWIERMRWKFYGR